MSFGVHTAYGELYCLPFACGREIVNVALVGHGLVANSELVVLTVAFDAHGDLCVWSYGRWGQVATDGGEAAVVLEGNCAGEFAVAFGGQGQFTAGETSHYSVVDYIPIRQRGFLRKIKEYRVVRDHHEAEE